MKRQRLSGVGDATEVEWKWLIAAPDCNVFIGLVDTDQERWARLKRLWREHEAEIRALWEREGMPAKLPPGHPAKSDDGPIRGRGR